MPEVPKSEGDPCPNDGHPVVRMPLPFTPHFILYCEVCGSSWSYRDHENSDTFKLAGVWG